MVINSSNSSIKKSNETIRGSNNEIKGDCNTIHGSNNLIKGDGNVIHGSNNNIQGNGNIVHGSNNTANGERNDCHESNNSGFYDSSNKKFKKDSSSSSSSSSSEDDGNYHQIVMTDDNGNRSVFNNFNSIIGNQANKITNFGSNNIASTGSIVGNNQKGTTIFNNNNSNSEMIMNGKSIRMIQTITNYGGSKVCTNSQITDEKTSSSIFFDDDMVTLDKEYFKGTLIYNGSTFIFSKDSKPKIINTKDVWELENLIEYRLDHKTHQVTTHDGKSISKDGKKEEKDLILIEVSDLHAKEEKTFEDLAEEEACVICFERKKICIIKDCRHQCICATCALILKKDENNQDKYKCPLCKGKIKKIVILNSFK